ncbi:TRAP transporter solute receptor, TAXI family [Marinospirillum celere]|uniref:TRAP transporter solute receptor, TAXI family n=1 Tax=Marinospirillum celere TaxID=1122252 RepID=A0A1I1H3W2_9GAMM|nr:TAXI family TRAP transporter solute-binding subunit [Marinospirillum celere]SFC18849.1 TRAP transporter solute receptor, TAXI family [Marinospirillum celere]
MLNFRTRWWLSWILVIGAALLIIYWSAQQATQSRVIRLATASAGGYYHEFGSHLKEIIEQQGRYDVELIETRGSVDNRGRLLKDEADMAIIMIGSATLQNLRLVAPLWHDHMHLIVRRDSDLQSLMDLPGRNITLGVEGSGYRAQATMMLDHLGIDPGEIGMNDLYFSQLLENEELEGAIVTTGMLNPDLRSVLVSGEFRLVPINLAEGYALNHSQINPTQIPAGTYPSVRGPLPDTNLKTLGTLAVLASRTDVPDALVQAVHQALFSEEMRRKAPTLVDINPLEDRLLRYTPMHPASERYYNPHAGLDQFSRSLAWLNENRWLILAFFAAVGGGWLQIKQLQKMRSQRKKSNLESGLEKIFREAVELERSQKEAKDLRLLHRYLNEALNLKHQAVTLAQGNHLNDSVLFLTTLQQCSDVLRQLEWRLAGLQVNEVAKRQAEAATHS